MHEVVTAVLLTAHLILIDVAMVGPLVCVWFDWRGARSREAEWSELGRRFALWSLLALAFGSVLGGVLLALRYQNDERYFRALAAIPRDRLWFAGAELLFSLLCLSVYVGLWRRWHRGRIVHWLLAVAAASNLMMHFPALFVIVSIISTRPGWAGRTLERAEFRQLLIDGEVLSRVAHVWLAAVVVTGVAVVWLALRAGGSDFPLRERCVRLGARLSLAGLMLQFPVGLWVTMVMPEAAREPLLGSDALVALAFLSSVCLAMVLLHVLSALVLGEPTSRQAWRATAVVVALILLMVTVRVRLNRLLLTPREAAIVHPMDRSSVSRTLALPESSVSIGGAYSVPPRLWKRSLP